MATARRVIYSSYVIPQENRPLEENTSGELIKHSIKGAGRTYGGKGIVDITATQWGEAWTSMQHKLQSWEDYSSNWEDAGEGWANYITISGETTLNPDTASASDPILFLYIKNLGTESGQALMVSLDDSRYRLYIPAGGSISLRGDGTTLQMQHVKVNDTDQATNIEFIIAK